MKKAQTEMIGLVIIVILIVLIGIIVINLSIKPSTTSESRTYTKASNLLNAIIQKTLCEKKQIADAIVYCYQNLTICNKNACTLVKDEVMNITKLSLESKMLYSFNVLVNNIEIPSLKLGTSCKGQSSNYKIYSDQDFTVKLTLC